MVGLLSNTQREKNMKCWSYRHIVYFDLQRWGCWKGRGNIWHTCQAPPYLGRPKPTFTFSQSLKQRKFCRLVFSLFSVLVPLCVSVREISLAREVGRLEALSCSIALTQSKPRSMHTMPSMSYSDDESMYFKNEIMAFYPPGAMIRGKPKWESKSASDLFFCSSDSKQTCLRRQS